MIILDSDVLSAMMHEVPDAAVKSWLDKQPTDLIGTTSITIYEVRKGIERLPAGVRQRRLAATLERLLATHFLNRVFVFDALAAERAAFLSANRERVGLNIALGDTLIAGIVLAYDATIATGNVKDFRDLGARVVNPWETVSGR